MNYYKAENHEQVLKLWNEMDPQQRNRERLLGEIPQGACSMPEPPFDDEMLVKHYEFTDEMLGRRAVFEKNCSCFHMPPCGNCMDYGELFPEEW